MDEINRSSSKTQQSSDNRHNKKAEQLKKDIQKEIERLKRLENLSSNSEEEKEGDKEVNEKETETETIEKEMQNIKEEALQEQRKVENKNKNYSNFDYSRVEKNW